jgi:hypothetical protein
VTERESVGKGCREAFKAFLSDDRNRHVAGQGDPHTVLPAFSDLPWEALDVKVLIDLF